MRWLEYYMKLALGGVLSVLSYLFGGLDVMLETLLLLIGMDIFTGILAGAVEGKLSSKVSKRGIIGKVLILVMVIVGHRLDLLGMEELVQGVVGINIKHPAQTLITIYYLGNEGLSIVENCGKVIQLPIWITKFFEVLKNKGDGKG